MSFSKDFRVLALTTLALHRLEQRAAILRSLLQGTPSSHISGNVKIIEALQSMDTTIKQCLMEIDNLCSLLEPIDADPSLSSTLSTFSTSFKEPKTLYDE